MGIREKINRNGKATAIVTIAATAIVLGWIVWQSRPLPALAGPGRPLFTADDGKSCFPDEERKIPPFMKDGKEAVRAYVFRSRTGGKTWVAYLERYSPEAKKAWEDILSARSPAPAKNQPASEGRPVTPHAMPDAGRLQRVLQTGTEVKRPGDSKWVTVVSDPETYGRIRNVKDSDGRDADPVYPDL